MTIQAEFFTPAYYDNVLSVAATDANDAATYFTNVSYNISVSAPGLSIVSTWGTNQYVSLSGTSMASPCAAGVAALVVSQHPEYTPQQVLEQVRVSADDIDSLNPGLVHQIGFGRVNAYRAVTVSSPGVELSDMVLSDSAYGNNDGTFTDGERMGLERGVRPRATGPRARPPPVADRLRSVSYSARGAGTPRREIRAL